MKKYILLTFVLLLIASVIALIVFQSDAFIVAVLLVALVSLLTYSVFTLRDKFNKK